MENQKYLQVSNLFRAYRSASGERKVLCGISLELDHGQSAAILGPSGSGKSTLLNCIGTLDFPDSGEVNVGGVAVNALSPDKACEFRNQSIGFIFQEHNLLPMCNVLENVLLPTMVAGTDRHHREYAASLLERVGLSGRENDFPDYLSGGERQRVAIARAMINRPGILLCDEPTGNLDHENGLIICRMLSEIAKTDGSGVIVVTHNEEFASFFDRKFYLSEGKLTDILRVE